MNLITEKEYSLTLNYAVAPWKKLDHFIRIYFLQNLRE